MGCDIHFHIELKDSDNNWHHYGCPDINRSYALFGFLAGVRDNEIRPIKDSNDKLPDDASLITRIHYDYWEGGLHNLRVFNQEDIEQMYRRWEEFKKYIGKENTYFEPENHVLKTYLFGNEFIIYEEDKAKIMEDIKDVRFIFWFDN